jgi:glycosyltransferase involved in cell wall biosynthesis
VVFVSHTASRVGPPIVLLALVRWLAAHIPLRVSVLFLEGGPLVEAYGAVADVWVLDDVGPADELRPAGPWPVLDQAAHRWVEQAGPDLVVVNSAASAPGLAYVPEDVPVVTFAHELDLAHHWYERAGGALRARSAHFLAGSGAIAEMLHTTEGIDEDRITLRYEFIEDGGGAAATAEHASEVVHTSTGVTPGSLLVGTCGVLEWRKGPDLFIQAAAALRAQAPDLDVHWMWIGGTETFGLARLLAEADRAGVADCVHFVGAQPDTAALIAILDVFVLPSRQDGFPLVCLEAASQRVPFVCFDQGGMPELARAGAGAVVPYGAVDDLAAVVETWLRQPAVRRQVGDEAGRLFDAHHAASVGAPQVLQDLSPWLP